MLKFWGNQSTSRRDIFSQLHQYTVANTNTYLTVITNTFLDQTKTITEHMHLTGVKSINQNFEMHRPLIRLYWSGGHSPVLIAVTGLLRGNNSHTPKLRESHVARSRNAAAAERVIKSGRYCCTPRKVQQVRAAREKCLIQSGTANLPHPQFPGRVGKHLP